MNVVRTAAELDPFSNKPYCYLHFKHTYFNVLHEKELKVGKFRDFITYINI